MNKLNYRTKNRQTEIQAFAFIIAMAVCVLLIICFMLSDPADNIPPKVVTLDRCINPNTATVASLMRLPGIGLSRANAIVAYRDKMVMDKDMAAFTNSDDLQNIKGIGPKTVENTNEYLKFE